MDLISDFTWDWEIGVSNCPFSKAVLSFKIVHGLIAWDTGMDWAFL